MRSSWLPISVSRVLVLIISCRIQGTERDLTFIHDVPKHSSSINTQIRAAQVSALNTELRIYFVRYENASFNLPFRGGSGGRRHWGESLSFICNWLWVHLIRRRHRLSSRASRSSEHVTSPTSSPSAAAVTLAFSAASLIWDHSELLLWMTLA